MTTDWSVPQSELFARVESSPMGLTSHDARERLGRAAPTLGPRRTSSLVLLARQFRSPTILILVGTAVVSAILGQTVESSIVLAIILTSGLLGFLQERTAVSAVHDLLQSVSVHSEVIRDGHECEILVGEVVVGDVVVLRSGDVVPGDARVIDTNRMFVDEAVLTGEAYPKRKSPGTIESDSPISGHSNMVYLGTYVTSGEGRVLVLRTGRETRFGLLTEHVAKTHVPTSFERGITAFGYLLMRVMAVLVAGIFVLNIALHRPFVESVLYSLALAVGLTPQMLPAIVTLSLSRGAAAMARRKVIVKRLDAIEDIGGLDILCVDKTGTITLGEVALEASIDASGAQSSQVFDLAWTTATHQRGFKNPIDEALLRSAHERVSDEEFVGEVPFDFARRRLSVVVRRGTDTLLVCKGGVDSVLTRCSHVSVGDDIRPYGDMRNVVDQTFNRLVDAGSYVLGVAFKSMMPLPEYTPDDEIDLVFAGFVTFADPPKPGIGSVVTRLSRMGLSVRIVTGDSRAAALHAGQAIGLVPETSCTGPELSRLSDEVLPGFVRTIGIFAEIDPIQKERVVRAFSRGGHSVGFLGDGINDTPALHSADVGISVTEAADIAKQTADVVLLNKDLSVLADGIEQGRRVFANTLKYVHVTTSANFGNMLSLATATALLPFLPMLPLQILLLNFLSDIPGLTIATDWVEPEHVARPLQWDITRVRNFMIVFGVASTLFDLMTFGVLRLVFGANAEQLRSGWFVESMLNELAVLLMLRTTRPLWRSRPGPMLVVSSAIVAVVVVVLPYLSFAHDMGLQGPSASVMAALFGITLGSIVLFELLKRRFAHLVEPG